MDTCHNVEQFVYKTMCKNIFNCVIFIYVIYIFAIFNHALQLRKKNVTFTGTCANEIIPSINRSFFYKAKEGGYVRIGHITGSDLNIIIMGWRILVNVILLSWSKY
jgi:hypothetical protein